MAVGTIAITSVAFICVTVLPQPCWQESRYDDHYWESNIDLENLSHRLHTASAKSAKTEKSLVDTNAGVDTGNKPGLKQMPRGSRDPQSAQEAPRQFSVSTSPVRPGVLGSLSALDGVMSVHDSVRVGTSDDSSSDDSVESFDSARDVLTVTHSRIS